MTHQSSTSVISLWLSNHQHQSSRYDPAGHLAYSDDSSFTWLTCHCHVIFDISGPRDVKSGDMSGSWQHSCVSASIRSNITSLFRLVDASRLFLKDSSSSLRSTTWAILLKKYSRAIRIHLLMILRFKVQIEYEESDVWIIFDNLKSFELDSEIINEKIKDDLESERVSLI
jgi:hypothetical protein